MSQVSPAQASVVGVATLVEAIRLEKEGRYNEATTRCQAVLKLNPRHPDALHLLGVIAMRQSRLADAEDVLRKTLKIAPELAEAHINLAHVYALQEKWRERIAALKAALVLLPGRHDLITSIGKCHESLGR